MIVGPPSAEPHRAHKVGQGGYFKPDRKPEEPFLNPTHDTLQRGADRRFSKSCPVSPTDERVHRSVSSSPVVHCRIAVFVPVSETISIDVSVIIFRVTPVPMIP